MLDPDLLRELVPFNHLEEETLQRLAKRISAKDIAQGTVICKEGDSDNDAIYVMEGGVEILSKESTMRRVVQGGTPDAAFALVQERPRPDSIVATSKAKILRIDQGYLDRVVVFDEVTTTITNVDGTDSPFEGDSEWLEQMTLNEAFINLPREKLIAVVMKMEPLRVKKGDVVVKQGDPAVHYYVIKSGEFTIARKEADGKIKVLSRFEKGDVFGEDALISGQARNASVVAMSDGIVMRLAKADFNEMIKKSLLSYVSQDDMQKMLNAGAELIDVRSRQEYAKGSLPNSKNIPVSQIRGAMSSFDPDKSYVVFCQSGVQSEVAAFILIQQGLHAFVLEGGMRAAKS